MPLPPGAAKSPADAAAEPTQTHDVAAPLTLNSPHGRLDFLTTLTVFGAPHDVTLSELAVETLLPADAATADALRRHQATMS